MLNVPHPVPYPCAVPRATPPPRARHFRGVWTHPPKWHADVRLPRPPALLSSPPSQRSSEAEKLSSDMQVLKALKDTRAALGEDLQVQFQAHAFPLVCQMGSIPLDNDSALINSFQLGAILSKQQAASSSPNISFEFLNRVEPVRTSKRHQPPDLLRSRTPAHRSTCAFMSTCSYE